MPVYLEACGVQSLSLVIVPVRHYKAIFINNDKASLFSNMAVPGYSDNLLVNIALELLGCIAYLHIAAPLQGNSRILAVDSLVVRNRLIILNQFLQTFKKNVELGRLLSAGHVKAYELAVGTFFYNTVRPDYIYLGHIVFLIQLLKESLGYELGGIQLVCNLMGNLEHIGIGGIADILLHIIYVHRDDLLGLAVAHIDLQLPGEYCGGCKYDEDTGKKSLLEGIGYRLELRLVLGLLLP